MTPHILAATRNEAAMPEPSFHTAGIPAFDPAQFADLGEMIGVDGVLEMVMIFEAETRERLLRVTAGGQDIGTLVREMHTLKGAAGTVAAPRLTALGRSLEHAASLGIAPTPDDLETVSAALEAWLAAVRDRTPHST
jgi:HPt (histidine-containing phosphotransfer) domain-containing protein